MANDSASGGPLAPIGPQQAQGRDFDRQIQQIVAGITGLPGSMVRPRWQAKPPPQPKPEEDWAAIGITEITADTNAAVIHDGAGDGVDRLSRDEVVTLLASFYGPGAHEHAALLRDGFSVAQNREALFLAGLGLIRVGSLITTGDLVNTQFVRRVDLRVWIRRRVQRAYAVRNLLSAEGVIATESVSQDFAVEN